MKKSAIKQFLSQNFVSMELLVPTNFCLKIYFLSKYFVSLAQLVSRSVALPAQLVKPFLLQPTLPSYFFIFAPSLP